MTLENISSTILYENIFDNVDLEYIVVSNGRQLSFFGGSTYLHFYY